MKKSLIVLQEGYKECGAASLLSIIRYYHGNISMVRLVDLTYTDQSGTDFYHLKLAAEEIGLEAVGYHVDDEQKLKEINKPFICQLIHDHYEHFVVVYDIKQKKVVMMDPAVGERIVSLDEFKQQWSGYIMIFSPKKRLFFCEEEKYLNKVIRSVIRSNMMIVFDILFLSIIFMIVSFFYALYFEVILDYVLDTTKNNLLVVTFGFIILLLTKCVTNFFRNQLLIFLNQKIDCSLLFHTFQKILLLPYNFYKNRTTGEVISRINDLFYVRNILNKIILTVFLDGIVFVCFSVILLLKNARLFGFLVLIILIYVFLFFLFRFKLKRYTEINQANASKLNSMLVEAISGFETIKNMNLESVMKERLEGLYLGSLSYQFECENVVNLELFMKDIISLIGMLLVQFLGFVMVMDGRMSLGSLLTFTFLANYILDPVKNILDLDREYFYAMNSIKRANHLFEVENENLKKSTEFVLKGNVLIHHLTFGYREGQDVLKNITMNIRQGDKVMILGSSGSGKSTILKLILKYYSVLRDNIYLDDIDLNDVSIANVREQVACLSQNDILFHDTIRNNMIAYRKVSEQEFLEVAQITCVDEFVREMFLGYETMLEENGLNLSGGQRQRIMLARMLLKASQFMLIDEGLNAVDVSLERKILKNMFLKYSEKTIIVVSHRMENLDLFDSFFQIEDGRIVQEKRLCEERVYD